ncbi:hypothetical protein Ancab_024667 [Ancistrocladus abbreviatus]
MYSCNLALVLIKHQLGLDLIFLRLYDFPSTEQLRFANGNDGIVCPKDKNISKLVNLHISNYPLRDAETMNRATDKQVKNINQMKRYEIIQSDERERNEQQDDPFHDSCILNWRNMLRCGDSNQ